MISDVSSSAAMIPDEVVRGLATGELFHILGPDQLKRIVSVARVERYQAGASLFQEGDALPDLYVVQEGSVRLSMGARVWSREASLRTIVSTVGRGGTVGWSSLVPPRLATLSAHAMEPCKLLAIPGRGLIEMMEEDGRLGYLVMSSVAAIASRRLQAISRAIVTERAADAAKLRWGF